MRIFLVLSTILLFSANPSFAQGGAITFYSTPDPPWGCGIEDTHGLVTVYLIHQNVTGSAGVRFKVAEGPGVLLTYLADNMNYTVESGDIFTGITICYEECLSDYIVLGYIHYFGQGLSSPCSMIYVLPHPEAATVEAIDCDMNVIYASGYGTYINPTWECPCNVNVMPRPSFPSERTAKKPASTAKVANFCQSVPVELSPWGKIKALYDR